MQEGEEVMLGRITLAALLGLMVGCTQREETRTGAQDVGSGARIQEEAVEEEIEEEAIEEPAAPEAEEEVEVEPEGIE
jgi:hypothetical protein